MVATLPSVKTRMSNLREELSESTEGQEVLTSLVPEYVLESDRQPVNFCDWTQWSQFTQVL